MRDAHHPHEEKYEAILLVREDTLIDRKNAQIVSTFSIHEPVIRG